MSHIASPRHQGTPYRLRADLVEAFFRRPDFARSSISVSLYFESRRLCNHRCDRDPVAFLPCKFIKIFKHCHHVSYPNPSSLSSHRCVRTSRRYRKYASREHFTISPYLSVASSGHSSPQSSVTSPIFSSSESSSSRSPPSQHSLTEASGYYSHLFRRPPRIQVSSLLADPFTRTYHLEVIQHPQKTAEFGQANLSRLPLTPPIIAQLTVRDPSGNSVVPEAELPFLIAHLSLFSADGQVALDMGSSIGWGQSPPILYGNLVSSVDQLEDLQGNMGESHEVWTQDPYLNTSSRSDPSGAMSIDDYGTMLAEARTRPFEVLPQGQYTAIPPTRLTQCFVRQGARMFTFMPHGA